MTKSWRFYKWLFTIAILLGLSIVGTSTVEAAGEYQGYDLNDGTNQSIALYVKETGVDPNAATDKIVYCFNVTRGGSYTN
ncbi:hypothetical protein [Vaginisenegalia massiliensis]|uniref:hypothetical protein n=1 Tax=Vaginisenegalia massiliensis TaxID=2058294 RepID=UPI000F52AF47|nr:hypothetical protein [Vaginisenegalia massiliensis]